MNQISDVKWSVGLACGVIEGYQQVEGDIQETTVEAWAFLIESGACWKLQGFYGRGASQWIESEIINRHGLIDWVQFSLSLE